MPVFFPHHGDRDGLCGRWRLICDVPDPAVKPAGTHPAFFRNIFLMIRLSCYGRGQAIRGFGVTEIRVIVILVQKVLHLLAGKGKSDARVAAHEISADGGNLHGPHSEKSDRQDNDGHQDFDEGEARHRYGG